MKKIYSYVLMAAMLLVGTNAWATTRTASNATEFENAWKAAQNNDVIQLTNDVTITKTLWLGTSNMYDDSPLSITLDLNGYTLTNESACKYMFVLTHGELRVTTSQAGGKIIQQNASNEELFRLTGSTYKNNNPKTDQSGFFTHLTIEAGVGVYANVRNAIVIDDISGTIISQRDLNGNGKISADEKNIWYFKGITSDIVSCGNVAVPNDFPYSTKVYNGKGVANGVRVDVKGYIHGEKYAFKANGNLGAPSNPAAASLTGFYADPEQTVPYAVDAADVDYTPFIHLYSSAELTVPASNTSKNKPVAVYCSGYARWLIEGTCVGSTAVYVKSGDVDINDAVIQSNYTGDYVAPTGTKSGVTGCGSAIVVESNGAYSGDIEVNISGDTEVTATNGYAIDEKVTTATETEVQTITISGGTFSGGTVPDPNNPGETMQGTITISEKTAEATEGESTAIVVAGGSVEGQVTFGNTGNLGDIIDDESSYATNVTNPETGQQTVVIKPGSEPVVSPNTFEINSFAGGDVNLSDPALVNKNQVFDGALSKMYINTLQINPPVGVEVTLTIAANHIIEAKSITMGGEGKIIVQPGAQLIVSGGEDGITTIVPDNLILQTSATQQAKFLINPAITKNRHPKATVEFVSTRAFAESPENYQSERFAIPTWGAITSIECTTPGLVTNIQLFDAKGWKNLGNLTGSTFANISQLNRPFAAYTLLPNNGSATPTNATYRFTGELTGNMDANLSLDHEWTPFANSYSANLDVYELMSAIPAETPITAAVYVHKSQGGGRYYWGAINEEWFDGEKLAPLQPFILHNESMTIQESALNYNDMVWSPGTSAGAPARRTAKSSNNSAKLRIVISDIQGECDEVKMTESVTNSNAPKYMNDDVNFFAHVGENNLSIVAAEDLEGTYFGFSTVKGGEFTINFTNVEGREFDLLDLDTNIATAVEEGNSYTFVAGANTNSDYRFKLVDRRKVATDIDAISAEKSGAQGIYTIMGQYVGEMNLWNTLPAGVYIVDGAKRVK